MLYNDPGSCEEVQVGTDGRTTYRVGAPRLSDSGRPDGPDLINVGPGTVFFKRLGTKFSRGGTSSVALEGVSDLPSPKNYSTPS